MKLLLFMFLLFSCSIVCHAQNWTREDSVKLQRIITGKEKINLNKETQKAIDEGTLIGPQPEPRPYKESLNKKIDYTFEGIEPTKTLLTDSAITDTIIHIKLNKKTISDLKSLNKGYHKKERVNDTKEIDNPHIAISVSFEDFFRYIFWPSERAKRRNAKRAKAYKTYNNQKSN